MCVLVEQTPWTPRPTRQIQGRERPLSRLSRSDPASTCRSSRLWLTRVPRGRRRRPARRSTVRVGGRRRTRQSVAPLASLSRGRDPHRTDHCREPCAAAGPARGDRRSPADRWFPPGHCAAACGGLRPVVPMSGPSRSGPGWNGARSSRERRLVSTSGGGPRWTGASTRTRTAPQRRQIIGSPTSSCEKPGRPWTSTERGARTIRSADRRGQRAGRRRRPNPAFAILASWSPLQTLGRPSGTRDRFDLSAWRVQPNVSPRRNHSVAQSGSPSWTSTSTRLGSRWPIWSSEFASSGSQYSGSTEVRVAFASNQNEPP